MGYYVGYKKTTHGDDKPYLFETVEFIKEQGHEHQLQISNLEVFTEYAVVVQAFNKIGQGPMSDEVLVHTGKPIFYSKSQIIIQSCIKSKDFNFWICETYFLKFFYHHHCMWVIS